MHNTRIVPERKDVYDILQRDHARYHDGQNKMEERLTEKYYMKGLRVLCKQVCAKNCPICAEWQAPVKKEPEVILTTRRMQLVQFDLTAFYRKDENECEWILTVVDHFSKYVWAEVFPTKESEPIARWLARLFTEFAGVPERWHADNGGEFVSHYIDAAREYIARNCDAEDSVLPYSHGLPYNPQCQGLVERMNRTLKTKVEKLLQQAKVASHSHDFSLPEYLSRAVTQSNRSFIKTYGKGITPYLLMHGMAPAAPDHRQISPGALANLHVHCAEAQVRKAGGMKPKELPFYLPGQVVRVRQETRNIKTAAMGSRSFPFMAVVLRPSATNENFYKLRWITEGLQGQEPGEIATRLYPASRLTKVTEEEQQMFDQKKSFQLPNVDTNVSSTPRPTKTMKEHIKHAKQ